MQTHELQHVQWLNAILVDERRRAMLRALLAQYELPVIQVGRSNRRQTGRHRTTPRNFSGVKRATI